MTGTRALSLVASALGLAAVAACTALLQADRPQCKTDGDCAARGAAFAGTACVDSVCTAATSVDAGADADASSDPRDDGGPFSCVGLTAQPTPGGALRARRFRLVDGTTVISGEDTDNGLRRARGVEGATVTMCTALDIDCVAPLTIADGGATTATTAPDGWTDVVVADDFNGYFLARADGFLPLRIFLGKPAGELEGDFLNALVPVASVTGLYALLGEPVEPDAGLMSMGTHDCNGVFAKGVEYGAEDLGPRTRPFYFRDGLPTLQVTETDRSSAGGLLNAKPGSYVVFAKLPGDGGARLASKRIYMRAGGQSHITFWLR